jgi:hypothetical protein
LRFATGDHGAAGGHQSDTQQGNRPRQAGSPLRHGQRFDPDHFGKGDRSSMPPNYHHVFGEIP